MISNDSAGPRVQRILVVEDEPGIRDFIVRALSAAGYAIDFACDGADGLHQALAGDYSLVILDLGAHDCLAKPFSLAGLLARVRVQRRGDGRPRDEIIRAGDLVLDVGRLEADAGNGPIALTRLEFLLLKALVEHAGQSVAKDQLLATIWGYDFDPGSNVVDVCVRRLRGKLGFDLIRTVRGAGYQLAC